MIPAMDWEIPPRKNAMARIAAPSGKRPALAKLSKTVVKPKLTSPRGVGLANVVAIRLLSTFPGLQGKAKPGLKIGLGETNIRVPINANSENGLPRPKTKTNIKIF
jgi:hypothetical protein